jgi:hypothetical protein
MYWIYMSINIFWDAKPCNLGVGYTDVSEKPASLILHTELMEPGFSETSLPYTKLKVKKGEGYGIA